MMAGWTMGTEAWVLMGAWALVMVLAVWVLVREPRREEREDALQTLRGRLARGEITPDEFERAKHLFEAN